MGRSYWFECSRCGYRTVVSGNTDRGHDFFVDTISCRDCKKLYDAVVKLRVPSPQGLGPNQTKLINQSAYAAPPIFQAALARLPVSGIHKHRWKIYKPACPMAHKHRIDKWRDPGPCPQCGMLMEKNPLPYRIWE